ncbi:MAG: glycine oxidase ThiO [Mariprofundaceae bacterium]|nr:glycine oxidase ThiO [Mariprofundaceae bacterium]
MTVAKQKVLIVGGGVIGCMTAWFLHRLGAEPIIVERGRVGQEASWAGAGILCPIQPWLYPDSFTRLIEHSLNMFETVQADIENLSGISTQWLKSGLLIPSFGDDEDVSKAMAWSKKFDWSFQHLNAEEAQQDTPLLSKNVQDALLWPDIAQVRNPRLLQALQQIMKQLSIPQLENSEVDTLLTKNNKVSGVALKGGERLDADAVLLAAGSWSGDLAKQWGIRLDVQPVKGQIALLKTKPKRLTRIVKHHSAYFVPRSDGRILVGASMELAGFERGTTTHEIEKLLQAVEYLMPDLKDAEIEHQWMGFRPGSPDGMPYLGPVKSVSGLWVSSGHYRNGVALAPLSADLMSRWIVGEKPCLSDIDLNHFAIERQTHDLSVGYPCIDRV